MAETLTPENQEFLDSMILGINKFQEHRHAAWNTVLPYDDRIKDLPLYALELNNWDRDQTKHGPTIAHYAPAKQEIIALKRIIENTVSAPRVLDIGCGNGFIGSLLAREGLSVAGIDDLSWNQPQIFPFYDKKSYEYRAPVSLNNYQEDFNVAFCSWMVPDANFTPLITAKQPELIIHVFSRHTDKDGNAITGCIDAYRCAEGYRELGAWETFTPNNFFTDLDNRLSSKPANTRSTAIWVRRDLHTAQFHSPANCDGKYYWDHDREAINQIRIAKNMRDFRIIVNPNPATS